MKDEQKKSSLKLQNYFYKNTLISSNSEVTKQDIHTEHLEHEFIKTKLVSK